MTNKVNLQKFLDKLKVKPEQEEQCAFGRIIEEAFPDYEVEVWCRRDLKKGDLETFAKYARDVMLKVDDQQIGKWKNYDIIITKGKFNPECVFYI